MMHHKLQSQVAPTPLNKSSATAWGKLQGENINFRYEVKKSGTVRKKGWKKKPPDFKLCQNDELITIC